MDDVLDLLFKIGFKKTNTYYSNWVDTNITTVYTYNNFAAYIVNNIFTLTHHCSLGYICPINNIDHINTHLNELFYHELRKHKIKILLDV